MVNGPEAYVVLPETLLPAIVKILLVSGTETLPNKDFANPTGILSEGLGQGCVVVGAVVVGGDDVY